MGVRISKDHDLLQGSEWLRTVVHHHQRCRTGVSGFESFTIEPATGLGIPRREKHSQEHLEEKLNGQINQEVFQEFGVRLFRVKVFFRNAKEQRQELCWLVKEGQVNLKAVSELSHEIKVYVSLMSDVHKFLTAQKNPRAKYLLNIPDFVFQERKSDEGEIVRCHLVLEDLTCGKRCRPLPRANVRGGLSMGQFKAFLGTLAQFHAAGMAWSLAHRTARGGSVRETYPFLFKAQHPWDDAQEVHSLLATYELLLKWQQRVLNRTGDGSDGNVDFNRRLRLLAALKARATDLLVDASGGFGRWSGEEPMVGLCLGQVMPQEVLMQYDSKAKKAKKASCSQEDWESKENEDSSAISCAAVTTCHRVHFGAQASDLALAFLNLPTPLVRSAYQVPLLQNYAHVLTTSLEEALDVDWRRQYRITFNQLLNRFYSQIPQALLRSILSHTRLTDPAELSSLIRESSTQGSNSLSNFFVIPKDGRNKDNNYYRRKKESVEGSVYIPLTQERLDFLVGLTDRVIKVV